MLWACVKERSGTFGGRQLSLNDKNKINDIVKSVKSLTNLDEFLGHICNETQEACKIENVPEFTVSELRRILNNFEDCVNDANAESRKLRELQTLYRVMHTSSMHRAHIYDQPHEHIIEDEDTLRIEENAQNQKKDNKDDGKAEPYRAISEAKNLLQNVRGDDKEDNALFMPDESYDDIDQLGDEDEEFR